MAETPDRSLFKSVLQSTGLYSIALLAQRVVGIVLLPVNTRFLSPSDYGVLELLEQVGVVVSVLLGINLSASLGYYFFETDTPDARRRVVGTTFVGSLVLGSIIGMLGAMFARGISVLAFGNSQYELYLRILFLSIPMSFLLEAAFSWVRIENRATLYLVGSLLRALLTIVGTVIFVAWLQWRIVGVLTTSISAIVLVAVFLLVFYLRTYRPVFDSALFMRMLRFAIPLGLSNVAMIVIHFGDRFFLPRYRPMGDLGIYAVAYKIGMLISVIYSSFHTYWSAQVYQIVKRDDAEVVIARMFTYVMTGLSYCALALTVAARPGLQILTAPSFHSAAALVPLIVGAYFVRSIGDFFRCFFLVANRPEWDAACNWIGAAVCVTGYVVLIPRYGAWGAAGATGIAFFVISLVSLVWVHRLRPLSVEGGRLFKVFAVAGVLAAASLGIPMPNIPAEIAWAVFLLLCYPVLLMLLRFPTAGELGMVRSRIGSLTARLGYS